MKLIIVHHHTNRGGVTRIIQSQISSLRQAGSDLEIELLAARVPDQDFFDQNHVKVILNEDLDYLHNRDITFEEAKKLYDRLTGFFSERITTHCIMHAHNLNLGKNPVMTVAVSDLAQKGLRLINHAHDFAEDRPEMLSLLRQIIETLFHRNLNDVLYPGLENYHYAVLNSFDLHRLSEAGVPEENLSLLPNPVHFEVHKNIKREAAREEVGQNLGLDLSKQIITYPVRVIRRKNIGELILFSMLYEERANWLVTQPPKNPVEIEFYEKWKKFCTAQDVKLIFEAGTKVDFESLLLASDVCITTSLREGFGMVFLEPWLLGTPVMGRNISYVTEDLVENGIEFPLLYDAVRVLSDRRERDFGTLDQDQQMEVLSGLTGDENQKQKLRNMNRGLEKLFEQVPEKMIRSNKTIIQQKYSLENYGKRLQEIYGKLG